MIFFPEAQVSLLVIPVGETYLSDYEHPEKTLFHAEERWPVIFFIKAWMVLFCLKSRACLIMLREVLFLKVL